MNRIGEPIAKCIISTLISVTLFSCHMDKESAITLFEQGKKMEKRMLPDSAVIMYQRAIKQSATQKDIEYHLLTYLKWSIFRSAEYRQGSSPAEHSDKFSVYSNSRV